MRIITHKEKDFIILALNSCWHEANNRLTDHKNPVGDIERETFLHQRTRAKELMDKFDNPEKEVVLIVTHSSEGSLNTHLVKVPSELTPSLIGTFSDVDDDADLSDVRDLIKTLGIQYDSGTDNILIEEFPDEIYITTYAPQKQV